MVNFVHVGGDKKYAHEPVESWWQGDVGMLELHHGKHQRGKKRDVPELGSEEHDEEDADEIGNENFADVESIGSGDIHLRVAMMYPVEAP